MTKLRWRYLNRGDEEVAMTAWHDSSGNLWALPQVDHVVRHSGNSYTVTDVKWVYSDGLQLLPTEIIITLKRWGTP